MGYLRDYWLKILERILKKQLAHYQIKIGYETIYFLPKDIIRAYGEGSYSTLVTTHKNYQASKNISYLEKELNGWGFIRINRSEIINVTHVVTVIKGKKSCIVMSDGHSALIPNRKEAEIIKQVVGSF